MVEKANAAGGDITAQIFPRPIGLVIGLELSGNPFVMYPELPGDRPPAAGRARRRDAQTRSARTHSGRQPVGRRPPADVRRPGWEWIFPLGDPPNYEPDRVGEHRRPRQGPRRQPAEEAYDRLLDDDGHAMLLVTLANFRDGSLDTVGELIRRDDVVLGLGDGGAHYGMICDASFPTYMLAHWARDRATGRLTVAEAIRELTSVPARVAGLADRGRIAVGYKADLNVIDHAAMRLHKPVIARDLPAGGRRLDQTADGYVATIVSGEVIAENGVPTDARPGKLVRGRQPAPARHDARRAAGSAVERRGRRRHQQLGSSRPHLRAAAAGAMPAAPPDSGRPTAQARRGALHRGAAAAADADHRHPAHLRAGALRVRVGRAGGVLGADRRRQRRRVRRAGHR